MTKEELSRAYTHKKVAEKIVSDISEFMPSDIIQAYEDGFNKAVELAIGFLHKVACGYAIRELLTGEPYEGKIIEDFKKAMEEEICG